MIRDIVELEHHDVNYEREWIQGEHAKSGKSDDRDLSTKLMYSAEAKCSKFWWGRSDPFF